MKKLLLVFGISVLLFSCEKNDLTNSEKVNNQDLMLKSGKPAQPGDNSKVFRYEGIFGLYFYDLDENLTAYIGVDPRIYCSGGGWDAFDILNFQDIVINKGDDYPRILRLIKQDDVTILVWEGIAFSPCPDFLSDDPLFSGTGHLVITDNDFYADFRENNNTNAWGMRLIGDGIKITYRLIWDGKDISTAKYNLSIMLR